ncbi:hypothetical protein GOP47_0003141 [Adiantum capillus-veneris]|uniref:Protein-S-isoprenylcysteine O-methyltransferase n=1 Tax=Adiantum capillus-veneris TaxID=13818 RepID=A0A9D4VBW2_ADICA|nr:hypothetical protein GOP47_0003141 [Adiantum capillus-veneris]
MANAILRHGLSPGGPRLQTVHHPKARQRTILPCKRCQRFPSGCPSPASLSLSSLRRAAIFVATAEAKTEADPTSDGVVAGEPFDDASSFRGRDARGPLQALQRVTPVLAIKWSAVAALALTAFRAAYGVFYNPVLWTYGSWFFVIWPLPVAVAVGIWSIFAALPLQYNKKKTPKVKERDQIFILAGAITWLMLVPLGLRYGYIQGWPLTLFLVYIYFFLTPAVVRLRQYGELHPKNEDKQWSSSPSVLAQILFGIAIVGSHWLAAYEGPHLYFTWNWQWPSCIGLFLLVGAYLLHYLGWYFLIKYFDRLVRPYQLVIFGPYRFIRHPIYTSYMLLFAGYCVALRAYKTLAFLVLASLLYYDQRARIEERQLEEAFGKEHHKVRHGHVFLQVAS